jgi:nucleotide-binding universal stress UspA family protein
MTTSSQDRVVVGVDGSVHARAALHWAADEAQRTGRGLHVLHAANIDWLVAASIISRAEEHPTRDDVLDAAVEHLENRYPDLDVTSSATTGSPAHDLVEASHGAYEMVLGTHGGSPSHVVLGSVAHAVTAHAACPVVLVPDEDAVRRQGTVVVGVDGSPGSARAVECALDQAALRGCSVVALHAWWLEVVDGYVVTTPGSPAWCRAEERMHEEVARMLTTARQHRPEVDVRVELSRRPAAEALAEASGTAALTVVGARGRGGFAGLLLGSVTRQLLMHAAGTVVVVRSHQHGPARR